MMKKTVTGFLILPLLAAVIPGVSAIHSRYYVEYQMHAQEYLKIEVLEISKDWCFFCSNRDIRVTAKVTEVFRTRNSIRPGDTIELQYRYTSPVRGRMGPGTVPLLEKGKIYPAFLDKTENGSFYKPAAGEYSFMPLRPQEMNK